jgi:predicted CXXCH cytochrome family protein
MMKSFTKFLLILIILVFITVPVSGILAENHETAPVSSPSGGDTEEFLKILVLEPGASCITTSCHQSMIKKKFIHAVGVDGMKCSRCHEQISQTRHEFRKISEVTIDMCAQCHRADAIPPADLKEQPPKVITGEEAKVLHKPFAEGKCTACHDAHSSDYFNHLKKSYPEGLYSPFDINNYKLCLECHKELEQKLSEPRTLSATMFRNGNVNLHYRHVNKAKGRSCKVCHHPHGEAKQKLLKDSFQFGKRMVTVAFEKIETGGQCATTCHRLAKYDRYKPEFNFIKTDPLPGEDATEEELAQSRRDDLERLKNKETGSTELSPEEPISNITTPEAQ